MSTGFGNLYTLLQIVIRDIQAGGISLFRNFLARRYELPSFFKLLLTINLRLIYSFTRLRQGEIR